jgi:hypothetical protein
VGEDPYRSVMAITPTNPAALTFRWTLTETPEPRERPFVEIASVFVLASGPLALASMWALAIAMWIGAVMMLVLRWLLSRTVRTTTKLVATQKRLSVWSGWLSKVAAPQVMTRDILALTTIGAELRIETSRGTRTLARTASPAHAEFLCARIARFLGSDFDE